MNRLQHLLSRYRMSEENLLDYINEKNPQLKNKLTQEDIFGQEIKISNLKKIDKFFNKSLSYYVDPQNIEDSKEESIFFRKDTFNSSLNLEAKRIVNKFEDEKLSFLTLTKLSELEFKRKLPIYDLSMNPREVALQVREYLYPDIVYSQNRDFLKEMISKLSENNVLIFEFIENHNKKEKANINGFYLSPNVIVLKRNQTSFKREIFTLAHEIGHYAINEEEIDDKIYEDIQNYENVNEIERWCDSFAFYFLAGLHINKLFSLGMAEEKNSYLINEIDSISQATHISSLSIYTHLLLNDQISISDYKKVKNRILEKVREWELLKKQKYEQEKLKAEEEGRSHFASTPKPIISPLFSKTLEYALDVGLISEFEYCKRLNIKPEKIKIVNA